MKPIGCKCAPARRSARSSAPRRGPKGAPEGESRAQGLEASREAGRERTARSRKAEKVGRRPTASSLQWLNGKYTAAGRAAKSGNFGESPQQARRESRAPAKAASAGLKIRQAQPCRQAPPGLRSDFGMRRIAEVERRALQSRRLVDHNAKSPVLAEEGQAITAAVVINAALGRAGDLAGAHLLLEQRQRDTKPFGNDGCFDRTAPSSNSIGFIGPVMSAAGAGFLALACAG